MSTDNYYQILGLPPTASKKEIIAAIAKIRRRDKRGDYAETLNMIEYALLGAEADNKSQEKNGQSHKLAIEEDFFVDIGTVSSEEKRRRNRHDKKAKELYGSALEDDIKPPKRLNIKMILLGIGIAALATVIYIFYQPVYDALAAQDQTKQAIIVLDEAKHKVETYIRDHKVFPDKMSFTIPPTAPYQVELLPDETLRLTFNQHAAPILTGHTINYSAKSRPNMGLTWECNIGQGFPESYRPSVCL